MDYFELINIRHSVRAYKPDEVEAEKLEKILEAARLAPTAANRQAFRIIVIKTRGNEEILKKIYTRDWFLEPPYVLCLCSVKEKGWVRSDSKDFYDVDAGIVMDHIILAATAQGLGSCWIGAFDADAAKLLLDLDESLVPVVFATIGYARDIVFTKSRKQIDDLVIYK